MALRDRADGLQQARPEQRDGKPRALGRGPQPVEASVGEPRLLMRLQEREAETEHARPALQAVDRRAALGLVEREVAEDGETVGVPARRLDRQCVGIRVPPGRMDHGRVDAALVHLLQHVVGREVRDLTVVRVGGLVVLPDVDLRIDDEHGVLLHWVGRGGRERGGAGRSEPRDVAH